jgi:hypothetical protein
LIKDAILGAIKKQNEIIKVSIYEKLSVGNYGKGYVMGLDQYAYAQMDGERVELAYWRKHANLQGWMERLYVSRGGKESFNCIDLKLTEDDILKLAREHKSLETTGGFFWGTTTPEKTEATEDFINEALHYILDGWTIVYSSWW